MLGVTTGSDEPATEDGIDPIGGDFAGRIEAAEASTRLPRRKPSQSPCPTNTPDRPRTIRIGSPWRPDVASTIAAEP